MKLDRHHTIAGQPIRKIRDFLRYASQYDFSAELVVERIGADITEALLAAGLIEPVEPSTEQRQRTQLYTTTNKGDRLACARLVTRIGRMKAIQIVSEFLRRVHEVNATEDLLLRVAEIHAFGSFITEAPDLGDIDLALRLERKCFPGKDWVTLNIERARATGRRMNFLERIYFGDIEVWKLLKNRNRYISLHQFDELAQLGCESKRIYPSLADDLLRPPVFP